MICSLDDLISGQVVYINHVTGPGAHRMAERGLYPGVRIEMIQPGKPCIIRLAGAMVGVRLHDMQEITVQYET